MMTPDERYADSADAYLDPELRGLVDDLDRLCATATLPPDLRACIDRAVYASIDRTVDQPLHARGRLPGLHRPRFTSRAYPHRLARPVPLYARPRARVISIAAGLALVLSGTVGYLHVFSPTPVSAQAILRRAAIVAAHPMAAPDQVVHEISTVSTVLTLNHAAPRDITIDVWTRLDSGGALLQQAATISATATGALYTRLLRTATGEQYYDPIRNDVTGDTWPRQQAPPAMREAIRDPLGIARMTQLARSARQGAAQTIRLLPQQTLDGAPVEVVRIDNVASMSGASMASAPSVPRLTMTLYIDARSYAIRGLDLDESAGPNAATHVLSERVTRLDTVPLASLPADTFSLHVPANAQESAPPPPVPSAMAAQPEMTGALAAILAQPDQPALLLSSDIAGLRLQGGGVMRAPDVAITSYNYGPDLQGPDTTGGPVAADGIGSSIPTARSFSIQINHAAVLDKNGRVPGAFTTRGAQPLTVTIAGQPVQAMYWALETNAPSLRELSYQQGTSWVMMSSQGLSKEEFFAAVGALVDGRRRPDVAARAQYESALWYDEVTTAAAASVGLYRG